MGLVHELEYLRIHPSLVFGARSEHNTKSLPGAFDLMSELVPLALGRRGWCSGHDSPLDLSSTRWGPAYFQTQIDPRTYRKQGFY